MQSVWAIRTVLGRFILCPSKEKADEVSPQRRKTMLKLEGWFVALFIWMVSHKMNRCVYSISGYCGEGGFGFWKPLYNASWSIQAELIKLGYDECPSCHWATKDLTEHLAENEWCRER